jgi:hypothetical protein
VRVLLVSAADVGEAARAAGADLFVAKPRAARDLAAAVRGVLAPA